MSNNSTLRVAGQFGGYDVPHSPGSNSGLCVTVVATTLEGSKAALDAARRLTKDLSARIVFLSIQVVPIQFPLDAPPVALNFTKQQQTLLALESSAGEED